ncbi:ABC transporter ATP-binding protein [Mesorhizobium sp. M0276]|uniref:ABC transporter ATP-binding protein n=1 Tax=Mesorhizobium sp. M0276 TaxID=2956928 RepID=UPI003336B23B
MSAVLEVEGLEIEIALATGSLNPVRGISFQVERGEVLGIVGESGCGKSLTSLALMGLLPKAACRRAQVIRFCGVDITRLSERRMADLRGNRMAMIFQEPTTSLNPLLTIGEQLTEVFLRHRRGNRPQGRRRAEELLEMVGIGEASYRLAQYPHQLSGGMRQRAMIAMALMCEPDLIIADEPTTALDVTIQAQVLGLFRRLQRELGMALIFITHDLGVVARLADRVMVMYGGEIVESASARSLFANPTHPYTQGLLSCLPQPGKPGRLGTIPGTVPTFTGDLRGCGFANRCAFASAVCRQQPITMRTAGVGHACRCTLVPEQAVSRAAAGVV